MSARAEPAKRVATTEEVTKAWKCNQSTVKEFKFDRINGELNVKRALANQYYISEQIILLWHECKMFALKTKG